MSQPDPDVDDSPEVITDALLTASRLLVAISARSIAEVDETITIPQFRTLVVLSAEGPLNLAALAARLQVQPSTTGRMVDRLVAAGLIERRPNPASRREVVIDLSRRGKAVVRSVTDRRRDQIAAVVSRLRPVDRRGLVRALTAFSAAGQEPPAAPS
ncbi:MAG: MarR family transcriptional regulator [Mycobacterium sp.]|nr:MarR family transcriptional regulator [Mycobacterium sp.]